MMQESPSTSSRLIPIENEASNRSVSMAMQTGTSVKDYILEKALSAFCFLRRTAEAPSNNTLYEDEVMLKDPDFVEAKNYSWAVLAYEKIIERGKLKSAAGPGNGYFDTVQLLLEQIEILSRKLKLSDNTDRTPYFKLIERYFPGMPALTRGLYPAILYFIALRIRDGQNLEQTGFIQKDYWNLIMQPSENMKLAANILISATKNMFDSLRYEKEGNFEKIYTEFEKNWAAFYGWFEEEMKEPYSFITPDLQLSEILELLPTCELYVKNRKAARRIAGYFVKDHHKVVASLSIYPRRASDNYENNRAYIHGLILIERASKNLEAVCFDTLHEVKILKFPE